MDLKETSNNAKCDLDIDTPLFQPYPNTIVFKDYDEYHSYSQPLYFRNQDSVSRRISIKPPDTPYFKIEKDNSEKSQSSIVAPGLEVKYIVTFLPHV